VEAQSIVDLQHEGRRYSTDLARDAFDGNRPNLFRLSFGVTVQAGLGSGQQNLKGMFPIDYSVPALTRWVETQAIHVMIISTLAVTRA